MNIFLPHGYEIFSMCLYDVFEEYLQSTKPKFEANGDVWEMNMFKQKKEGNLEIHGFFLNKF